MIRPLTASGLLLNLEGSRVSPQHSAKLATVMWVIGAWWCSPVVAQSQGQNTTEKDPAVLAIRQLGGKVERNKKKSDEPVVAVDLHGRRVTDADLAVLRQFPQLQKLNLYNTPITDAGLAALEGLNHLHTLYLNGTSITDAGIIHLVKLPELRDLGLHGTRVTDAGLVQLQGVKTLQTLNLGTHGYWPLGKSSPITDQGLAALKSLPHLQTLYLIGTRVTDAGIKDLQQTLPKLKVVR
jgi:hypothetical protein